MGILVSAVSCIVSNSSLEWSTRPVQTDTDRSSLDLGYGYRQMYTVRDRHSDANYQSNSPVTHYGWDSDGTRSSHADS